MNRLQNIERELIAKKTEQSQKKQLNFEHFRNLSKVDRQ
jgi:hypothetical protein